MPGLKQWSQAAWVGALALLVWSSPASSETVTERAGSVDRDSDVSGDTDSLGADAVDSQAGTLSKTFNAPDPRTFRDFTEQEKQNQAPESKIDLILSEGWSKDSVSESETAIGVGLLTNDFENANQHPILADGNLKGGSGGSGGNGGEDPHWAARVTNFDLQLTASSSPSSTGNGAATNNEGTVDSPRTLLSGRLTVWPEYWPDEVGLVATISLNAYSDSKLSEQTFPETVSWSVVGGEGNFKGNALEDPRTKEGTSVQFYATSNDKYTFKATVGSYEKTIDVYVVQWGITSHPEYAFADSPSRVPLKFRMYGASGTNFFLDDYRKWRVRYFDPDMDFYFDMNEKEDLESFAPNWSDTQSYNGEASQYCIVSKPHPFENIELTGQSGINDKVRVELNMDAHLELGDEQTNTARISSPDDAADGIRFFDKRWRVIEIDKPRLVTNSWVTLRGVSYYDHIASDNDNFACSGFSSHSTTLGTYGTFTAGSNERYDAINEMHYHTSAPRGFDESDDHVFAGLEYSMISTGCSWKTRLFDGEDYVTSDDEEEYVARTIGGGISSDVTVAYGVESSSYFGDYYDLGKTSGNVFPEVLPGADWKSELNSTAGGVSYTSVVIASAGLVVSAAGAIALWPTAPVWISVGATVAGLGISSVGVVQAVTPNTTYGSVEAIAELRQYQGRVAYDGSTQLSLINAPSATGTGTNNLIGFPVSGAWAFVQAPGFPVEIGDRVGTGFDIFSSVQVESNEWRPTADAFSRVYLDSNGLSNLTIIDYSWR